MKRKIAIINTIVTIALIYPISIAQSRPVPNNQESQIAGKANLFEYCQRELGPATYLTLIKNDAYSWRCQVLKSDGQFALIEIDVDKACQQQYGQNYRSGYVNFNDPLSWVCWRYNSPR